MIPKLIAVMGPTASGKTELAERLADELDAQLINADAFQVYRGLDIGTAKPETRDRYLLLDLKKPDETFGVGEYVQRAHRELERLYGEGRNVVVVGGTGLYVRALFESYDGMGDAPPAELREFLNAKPLERLVERLRELDPERAEKIDLQNRVRVQRSLERILAPSPSIGLALPPFCKAKLAVVPDVPITDERVARRIETMMQNGWVEEVRRIRSEGYSCEDPGLRAIGYRTLWRYIEKEVELGEAVATTIAETRRYAKRQRTWLRSEPNLIELDMGDALADARRHLNMQ
ncbi:tRNA (adenosine(37)-N6)-dimethylallyltransferase MiaA [Fimbriimonas ginsengisoli]|uniref:tRNA dimethylallyltransferase n=1 Tax=Fimbriimonas ginsengisoli Gsoil 348 TaxID=661478 RepID=A0A068NZ43_FIMGI|nr:tRNA (adenosine(37)-N6)-dimethylallyltransferase MiaA [Fimbriimonas ginsengisoli]AIE87924.1 tRNA delta(2)-isopentenylpyrophosphate transferase [Fimbriimonas ginsengisoli Gsoil 348]